MLAFKGTLILNFSILHQIYSSHAQIGREPGRGERGRGLDYRIFSSADYERRINFAISIFCSGLHSLGFLEEGKRGSNVVEIEYSCYVSISWYFSALITNKPSFSNF